jgi:hypothetical protein
MKQTPDVAMFSLAFPSFWKKHDSKKSRKLPGSKRKRRWGMRLICNVSQEGFTLQFLIYS